MRSHLALLASTCSYLLLHSCVAGAQNQCVSLGSNDKIECTTLQPRPWEHTACDAQFASATFEAYWCEAFGGTGGVNCSVPLDFTENNLFGKSQLFAWYDFAGDANNCSLPNGSDSGWGTTSDSTGYCASGSPGNSYGFLWKTYRELQFQNTCTSTPSSVNVFASKQRDLRCPAAFGYTGGTPPTEPELFCARYPINTCSVADPVRLMDSQLIEWQEDFPATDGGLLEWRRVYRSEGQFIPAEVPHAPDVSTPSFWQTNFDVHLYALDALQYPVPYLIADTDGKVRYFTPNGTEWVHYAGNAAEQLLIQRDGNGNVLNYVRVMSDERRETFSNAGVLVAVDDSHGHHLSLAYNTANQLSSVTDEKGRSFSVVFNADGLLASVTNAAGQTISYGYDSVGNLTTATYPDANTRTYRYESTEWPHAWTGITDENSANYAAYTYASNGYVTDTVHAPDVAGGTIEHYHIVPVGGFAVGVTEPLEQTSGNYTIYYLTLANGVVNMSSVSQPCEAGCGGKTIKSRTYDAAGYVQSTTDFNGNVASYIFDDTRGLETQRVEASNTSTSRTTNTTWNANFRVPDQRSVVSAAGTEALTKWAYNSRGQPLSRCEIDPTISGASSYTCGSSTNAPTGVRQSKYTYCNTVGTCPLVGLLLSVDGPRTDVSDVTTYTYYATTDESGCAALQGSGVASLPPDGSQFDGPCHRLGDLNTVTNALGQVTTYVSYDRNGRVVRIKDANGVDTDMTYHERGWLATRTVRASSKGTDSEFDAITTFDYDNVGNVTSVTQPDGASLSYTYDAAHRLTDITDSLNDTIHYTLDAAGNRTDEKTYDPSNTLSRSLSRQYDQLNRLTALLNSANTAVQSYTNPAEAAPTGITYTDGYDGNGNAIYSIDGTSNHIGTEQQYDPLNRLVKTLQDHAGTGGTHDTTTQYAYDARNNLRSVIDPDNLTTSYTYDGLNNLTSLSSPDTGLTKYYDVAGNPSYDAAGNRLQQTDARGVISTYSYDALNRLVGIGYPTTSLNVTYGYDAAASGCYNTGRLTQITDNSGNTTYCYDRRGNVTKKTQVTSGTTLIMNYTYTLADRLATVTYPSTALVTYTRNSIGQIINVAYKATPTSSSVTLINTASYLPFGPLNVLTFGNGRTLTKSYDNDYAIDRVVSSSASGLVVDATVDALGNLVNASSVTDPKTPTLKYQYDPLYRLTEVDSGSNISLLALSYDLTGDRTSKTPLGQSTQGYFYAANTHHLTNVGSAARTYDLNGNTQTANGVTFTYDDRYRLSAAAGVNYNYNGRGERVSKGSPATLFVYAENGQLLGEYNATGVAQKEYIPMDGIYVGMVAGSMLYYIETDQLGTPRQVIQPGTTTATDTTVWKWDYFASNSAFGENTPSVQTLTFNLRFPGQYFDGETGLNYNYFRDYEAGTGRYVESDRIGLRAGVSTYAYVINNPLRYRDTKGLQPYGALPPEQTSPYPRYTPPTNLRPPPKPSRPIGPALPGDGRGIEYPEIEEPFKRDVLYCTVLMCDSDYETCSATGGYKQVFSFGVPPLENEVWKFKGCYCAGHVWGYQLNGGE